MSKKKSDKQLKSLVMVKWRDAHADFSGNWIHESEIDMEPYYVTSVGISITGCKPNHISVCQSYAGGMVDHVLHIPDAMVDEVIVIGTAEIDDE